MRGSGKKLLRAQLSLTKEGRYKKKISTCGALKPYTALSLPTENTFKGDQHWYPPPSIYLFLFFFIKIDPAIRKWQCLYHCYFFKPENIILSFFIIVSSEVFWWWCITYSISLLKDFISRYLIKPFLKKKKKLWKWKRSSIG